MIDKAKKRSLEMLSEVKRNYDSKRWWHGRINQWVNSPVQQSVRPPSSVTPILDKEWDTLIILDACRADLFSEVITNKSADLNHDNFRTVQSNASATNEWLRRNFGSSHGDIVYVSGNPMVTRHRADSFYKLIDVWRNAYDTTTSIVSPQQVTNQGIAMWNKHPNKRIIIHYMQPHYPFIEHPELNYANFSFEDLNLRDDGYDRENINSIWDALAQGQVDKNEVWEAYRENLVSVFTELNTILSETDDRVVVTSDHGNLLGEYSWPVPVRTFGHPPNLRQRGLIEVPWVVREGRRRNITRGTVSSEAVASSEEVTDRLSSLGYA